MPVVHQVLATFSRRDAIGEHAIRIQRTLASAGVGGGIFAATVNPGAHEIGADLSELDCDPDDLLLYHASIGSPVADTVIDNHQPIIVDYHNITPAEYFRKWEPAIEAELALGRRQLRRLAIACRVGLADSSFNATELADAGCTHTAVAPILLDLEPDPATTEQIRAAHPGPHWLFVGRIAPNKAQHDLIKTLAVHRRHIDPTTQLTLIGNTSSSRYLTALKRLTHHLDCDNAVTFTGAVDNDTLAAHYQAADLFICLSEHEGFCVPLLEAMHHHTPIIAYDSTAVAETLGTAGLLLTDKRPLTVATAAHHLHTNPELRQQLDTNAQHQLTRYNLNTTRQQLLDAITPHLT